MYGEEPLQREKSMRAEAVMTVARTEIRGPFPKQGPGAAAGEAWPRHSLPDPGWPWVEPPAALAPVRLEAMRAAGEEVRECSRVLRKAGLNVVGEVLRGERFVELEHYPGDDVYDRETHSQYYYHAHRGSQHEHGHFHTFLRRAGMPPGVEPVSHPSPAGWPQGDEAIAHLIGISMDAYGEPVGLFAVNRWVGGETWYPAEDVIRMLDRFRVDHAYPSWPVNRWITAMFILFRPEIEALLRHRDRVIAAWGATHAGDPLEDRALEITGWIPLDVSAKAEAVAKAVRGSQPDRAASH